MKRTKYHIFYFLITITWVLLGSCEKTIEMDISNNPIRLVVNSFLNEDSVFIVRVSRSQYVLDDSLPTLISDAKVLIYEDGIIKDTLMFNNHGKYRSKIVKPVAGKKYKIEVSKAGYNTVTSYTYLPVPVSIISVDTFRRTNLDQWNYSTTYWVARVNFTDPLNEENYYILSSYANGSTSYYNQLSFYINSPIIEAISYDYDMSDMNLVDEGINLYPESESKRYYTTYALFSDNAIRGKNESFDLEFYSGDIGYSNFPMSTFKLQLYSISKDYYLYIKSVALYRSSSGPFTEKVQVYNNINEGFGIFAGYSYYDKSIW